MKLTRKSNIDRLKSKIWKDGKDIAEIRRGAVIYEDGTVEPFIPSKSYEGVPLESEDIEYFFTDKQIKVIEAETGLPYNRITLLHGLEDWLYWGKKGKKPLYPFSEGSMKEIDKLSKDKNGNYIGYNSIKFGETIDKIHDELMLKAKKEEASDRIMSIKENEI